MYIQKSEQTTVVINSGKRVKHAHLMPHFTGNQIKKKKVGAQWLSGRVLDSRLRDRGFEPHQRHCLVVLEQDTFILA